MTARRRIGMSSTVVLLLASASAAWPQRPVHIAPNAPAGRPVNVTTDSALARLIAAMQPWVDSARATYTAAQRRFLKGLPAGESFFVTTRLADERGRMEQVFVAVDSIVGKRIYGRIRSRVTVGHGYASGRRVWLWQRESVDWLIMRPDGTEEGNVVGKFLDHYHGG